MNGLAAGIERWNAFAPTLPLAMTIDLLWVAVPLAIIALLFLAVFSCGRRATIIAITALTPLNVRRPGHPSHPRPRTARRAQAPPHGPRGPTQNRVAALA